MTKFIDLTGQRFGRYIVIGKVKSPEYIKYKGRSTYWLCRCDCGKEKIISGYKLRKNSTLSCGCYHNDSIKKAKGYANSVQLYIKYKGRAKRKNLSFKLSKKYFLELTQKSCFYCGVKPYTIINKKGYDNGAYIYNGIDRIDNTKGYVKNNVVACCKICNYAKRKMSINEFLEWAENLYNHSIKNKKGETNA